MTKENTIPTTTNPQTVKADYVGKRVDGQRLFAVRVQIPREIQHPVISPTMVPRWGDDQFVDIFIEEDARKEKNTITKKRN
jgi:hypothetical protein